jgi:hypothetical protein
MSPDRFIAVAQRQSGTALELLGRAMRNPELATRGRALRAQAGLREVIHAAKATLRTLPRPAA